MRSLIKVALLGALGLGVGQLGGCASERDPINRVQANAMPKAFFLGQDLKSATDDPSFYARATVTDVGFGAAQDGVFTSTYAQPVSILKWEVTENFLIGRLAYERIDGTDGKGKRPGLTGKNEGQIAYMYRIESHFDVRRDFNPQTGEESNVIVENTVDRPWFAREQMRVDFSQNLISDAYELDTLSMMGLYGGVKYSPLAYYASDPGNFDAPHFEQSQGYFDITNKALATPELLNVWGSKFPSCMLPSEFSGGTENSGANCNPTEITIRQSFRRVEANDYEPYDQDGVQFRAYGAFTEDRKGFARNYGLTDNNWHRFVSRYDIWARNHYYKDPVKMTGEVACYTDKSTGFGGNPNRDIDGDGTEDECVQVTEATGVAGSKCDKFSQKCTLPYQLREQVPVVWYVTANSSQDYFDGSANATHEWDVAMRLAGQSAKYAECKSFGSDPAACDKYAVYKGQQDENDDAIALARDVDQCRHAGKSKTECDAVADSLGEARKLSEGVIAVAKLPEAVVLCHSPVESTDPEICGDAKQTNDKGVVTARARLPKGITAAQCTGLFRNGAKTETDRDTLAKCNDATVVRLGDLRYHVIHNIEAPQDPSSWGIMTDAADPLTGRKVAGAMNIWTHINDIWSQGVVDQLRYIKQELKTSDITEGTNVRDWAAAAESLRGGGFQTMDKDQVATRIGAAAGLDIKTAAQMPKFDARAIENAHEAINAISAIRGDSAATSYNRPVYEARRAAAANTELDARLTTPMMQQYAGFGRTLSNGSRVAYTGALQPYASPLQMQHPSIIRDFERMKQNALADRGACMLNMESPAPFSMAPLADEMEAKFGKFNAADDAGTQGARAARMQKYLAQKVHYAVIVHEMGHSIGLRHNFVSSYNSLSYRPQYWQLRTKNGKVTQPCTDLTDGAACVGPRYFDPVTKEESDGLIQMWMQSSTMDYAGEFTQDFLGLGSYDFSAARAFYGNTMSVYADKTTWGSKGAAGRAVLNTQDGFGGILGMRYSTDVAGNADVHYSTLQNVGKLIKDCYDVDPNDYKPAGWNEERDGIFNPTLDGHIVKVDGKYTRCRTQQVDYVPWAALRAPVAAEVSLRNYRGGPSVDKEGRVRVLNGFGTDSWADLGNMAVYRHDNGADPYELMTFFIAQPEVMHIFNNYRRGRNSFSVRGAANRWLGRYNEKMRDAAKGLGLITNIYRSQQTEILDQLRENTLASGMAFDAFTRQMARPQEGAHYQAFDGILRSTADLGEAQASAVLLNVPNGATGYFGNVAWGGSPIENKLAGDKGEYNNRYTVNAGSYYQKIWTPMLFTESIDNFISDSRGDFTDPRYRSVSMADLFPDGYRRWLGNNLTGDDFIKGVRVEAEAVGGRPKVEAGTRFPASAMGITSWWKPTPEVCFPKNGTTICSDLTTNATGLGNTIANTAVVDPQVSWEQQKFLIAMTMMYLPENQKFFWLDQMNTWELGRENDPGFTNRIELHQPNGKIFIAKTFGKEAIFGKTVQKGIAARVLEYANELMRQAYQTTSVTQNGTTWFRPVLNTQGLPVLKDGVATDCNASTACRTFEDYMSVVNFLRGTQSTFGFASPDTRGFY